MGRPGGPRPGLLERAKGAMNKAPSIGMPGFDHPMVTPAEPRSEPATSKHTETFVPKANSGVRDEILKSFGD